MTMTGREWWIFDNGVNALSGIPGDVDNPAVLTDVQIIDFLRSIPEARDSFNRLYPTMLPEERERLDTVCQSAQYLRKDPKAVTDMFQARQNTDGIFTTGPLGGTRIGGNS
jgi:hypothetical protein